MNRFTNTSVVVTGGAGFIGSHLVDRLLSEGATVTVIDDLDSGSRENLPLDHPNLTLVEESIVDADLPKLFRGAEYVFHQAAIASVPRTIDEPLPTHRVNVEGSLRVLLAAQEAGVERIVYASSSAVYGDSPELPKREAMRPEPISPYALHKMELELYAKLLSEQQGLETVGLRYFNVFGPRQSARSAYAAVIPIFIERMSRGEQPIIFGDGITTRDFVYVDDVVEANINAALTKSAAGGVCNIASGSAISLNDLVAVLNNLLGTTLAPIYEEARAGDIPHTIADLTHAKELIGFEPTTTLEEGLRKLVTATRQ